MIPVRAVQDGTDLSFDILITRHPDQCVRNCSLYALKEECSARECFCQTVGCLRTMQLAHVPVSGRLIPPSLSFVWAPCRSTKVFKLQEPFSVGDLVSALMMDTGCCATADFKTFSLSVDMSLFPVTLPVRPPCCTRGLASALHGVVTLICVHKAVFSAKSNPLLMSPVSHA